jgi:hypothetical protein
MTVAALIARGVDPHRYITTSNDVYRELIDAALDVVVKAEQE